MGTSGRNTAAARAAQDVTVDGTGRSGSTCTDGADHVDNTCVDTCDNTCVDTAPVPGMVYLRRPAGRPTAPRLDRVHPEGASRAMLGGPSTPPVRDAVTAKIARLLTLWLEAFDGRRPVAVLRRAPFSPTALDTLRAHIRDTLDRRGTAHPVCPSRILRVHLPPSHHRRLSFTASAEVDGRVRALVGHLERYDSRWRVENVTLV